MTKVHPCNVCIKDAVGCFSPDLDIKGLCFCEEHKKQVMMAYMALMQGDKEMCDELLGLKGN